MKYIGKIGSVRILLSIVQFPLNQMLTSCKCFPLVRKMPTVTYNWANNVIINNVIILNIIHNIFNRRDTEVVMYNTKETQSTQIRLIKCGINTYYQIHTTVPSYSFTILVLELFRRCVVFFFLHFMNYHRVCNQINTTDATSGTGTATLPEQRSSPQVVSGVRVTQSLPLYFSDNIGKDRVLSVWKSVVIHNQMQQPIAVYTSHVEPVNESKRPQTGRTLKFPYIMSFRVRLWLRLGLWCLTQYSKLFQLNRGGQLYCMRKLENPEKNHRPSASH